MVADQLKISDGWVRCGHCSDVFDATIHLQAWAPTPGADAGPATAPQSDTPEPPPASVDVALVVADDVAANVELLRDQLQLLGYRTVEALDGPSAVRTCFERLPDLCILDVAMPGMDGFETARLVRSRARNRATPIIFITGLSWQDDAILKGSVRARHEFPVGTMQGHVQLSGSYEGKRTRDLRTLQGLGTISSTASSAAATAAVATILSDGFMQSPLASSLSLPGPHAAFPDRARLAFVLAQLVVGLGRE